MLEESFHRQRNEGFPQSSVNCNLSVTRKGDFMERLVGKKKNGINGNTLRAWGLIFLVCGVIGRGVIQTWILGVGSITAEQLLSVMGSSDQAMRLATISLILQAVETCAIPIFALILTEGVQHTSDFQAYFLRIFALALLTEIPYNLAISGKFLDLGTRNPVFSLVLCLVMLYLYSRFPAGKFINSVIKVIISAVAILWCEMLKIEFGSAMILVTAVLWALRKNPLYRNFAGAAAAIVCTVFSPFFLAAPMGFMAVHLYNGEQSTNSRIVNYLAYPCILMAAAAVGLML